MAAIRWTAEHEAQLAHLCATTTMSAGKMADVMGKPRNAVIGKAGRMGLVLPNAGKHRGSRTVNRAAKPRARTDVHPEPVRRPPDNVVVAILGAVQAAIDKDPSLLKTARPAPPKAEKVEKHTIRGRSPTGYIIDELGMLKIPATDTPDPAHRARFGVLTEAPRNRCLFPVDDGPAGPDMLCCGAKLTPGATGLGKSFCAHHVRRSNEKRKPVPAFVLAALPRAAFAVLYADVPWPQLDVWSEETGNDRAYPYPTMELDAIKALCAGENSPATKDAVLFFWTTANRLDVAVDVIRAWGFCFKASMVWDKVHQGTGRWVRDRHEVLMIATRGDIPAPLPGTQPQSLFAEPKGAHSAKPDCVRQMINTQFPGLTKLELFARGPAEGWSVWGNEAEDSRKEAS